MKTNHHIYDYVFTDSQNEREFVEGAGYGNGY